MSVLPARSRLSNAQNQSRVEVGLTDVRIDSRDGVSTRGAVLCNCPGKATVPLTVVEATASASVSPRTLMPGPRSASMLLNLKAAAGAGGRTSAAPANERPTWRRRASLRQVRPALTTQSQCPLAAEVQDSDDEGARHWQLGLVLRLLTALAVVAAVPPRRRHT